MRPDKKIVFQRLKSAIYFAHFDFETFSQFFDNYYQMKTLHFYDNCHIRAF